MKATYRGATVLVLGLVYAFLAGCGTMPAGPYNGYSHDAMTKVVLAKYPGLPGKGGKATGEMPYPTASDYALTKWFATSCQSQVDPQLSSPGESVVSVGLFNGVTGGLGIASGALAWPYAVFHRYFQYGGSASGASGGASGVLLWSYNEVSIVGTCTSRFLKRAGYEDLMAFPSYVRAVHPGFDGTSVHNTAIPAPSSTNGSSDTDYDATPPPPG